MLQFHRHCVFRNVSEFAASLSRMRSGGEESYTSVEESCGDMFRANHMTWQRSSSINVSLDIKTLRIIHVGAEVLRKASFYTHRALCSQNSGLLSTQHHCKKRARTRTTFADVLERVCRVRTLARFGASRPCGKSRKPIIMYSHKHSRLPRIQWKDLLVVVHLRLP